MRIYADLRAKLSCWPLSVPDLRTYELVSGWDISIEEETTKRIGWVISIYLSLDPIPTLESFLITSSFLAGK